MPSKFDSIWKRVLLVVLFLSASICIVVVDVFLGGALFIAALILQNYGGFCEESLGQSAGEKWRVIFFVSTWIFLTILVAATQLVIPNFNLLTGALSEGFLLTGMQFFLYNYPFLKLLPILVGGIGMFQPLSGRTMIATWLGWFGILICTFAMGLFYFPLFVIA